MKSIIVRTKDILKYEGCVLTYGHFSTIHTGHIRYLKYAKLQGGKLITAILPDASASLSSKYPFNQSERAESLALLGLVDVIVLLENDEESLRNLIEKIQPKNFILGKEFKKTKEKKILEIINLLHKKGIPTRFHAGEVIYSRSDLLQETESNLIQKQRERFLLACKKQKLELNDLVDSIDKWRSTSLVVVGDTIIDQYSACEALGMSAEAPVVVVKELENKNFIGGAAIVASHIKELGAKCHFLSVVGSDATAQYAREQLTKRGISQNLFEDPTRPTTFKKRYLVDNQKLFRVSRLEDHLISEEIEKKIIESLDELAPEVNGIVISDFCYGVITPKIVKKIINLKSKFNLSVFGDMQCSSQVGSITKFKNFSLLCPNEREARLSLMDKESGLETLSQNLIAKTNTKRLIMKLGNDGFISYDRDNKDRIISQSFPSLSVNPLDVAGAGDSLIAVMSIGLSSGQQMMHTSALACCMAALSVEQMGNTPVSASKLKDSIKSQFEL